jgi:hypothetical protein
MPFTLFCLGTDTNYTPEANYLASDVGAEIKLQETLSAVSGYITPSNVQIAPLLFPKRTVAGVHVLHNQAVVIDGPGTTGWVVHDKIVQGLIAILDAVLLGEQNINIVGFSRGAVISIHITHELQRIQQALRDALNKQPELSAQTICDIICDTRYTFARNHIREYYKVRLLRILTKHSEYCQTLLKTLGGEAFNLNVFALDPVPGLCEYQNPISWACDRHYSIPPIVNNAWVVIKKDERSNAFRPIIPSQSSEQTTLTCLQMFGIHGTGDGNPFNHDPQTHSKTGFDFSKTRGVQTIVFYQILAFLEKTGVTFIPPKDDPTSHLDEAYKKFAACASQADKERLLCAVYDEILANRAIYQEYTQSNYAYIGREEIAGERIVMLPFQGKTGRAAAFSEYFGRDEHFVNKQHFLLTLNKIRADLGDPADEQNNQPHHVQIARKHLNFVRQLSKTSEEMHPGLQKILLAQGLDTLGIMETLKQTAPDTLAKSFIEQYTSDEDLEFITTSLDELFKLNLDLQLEPNANLLAEKKAIVATLKTNFVATIQLQLNQYLDDLNKICASEQEKTLDSEDKKPVNPTATSEMLFIMELDAHYKRTTHLISRITHLQQNVIQGFEIQNIDTLQQTHHAIFNICTQVIQNNRLNIKPSVLKATSIGQQILHAEKEQHRIDCLIKRVQLINDQYNYNLNDIELLVWNGSKKLHPLYEQINKMYLHGVFLHSIDQNKGMAATTLALELKQIIRDFMRLSKEEQAAKKIEFKQQLIHHLHSKDDSMTIHRARWKMITANFLIALTGVGILAISAHYLRFGKCFFAETQREKCIAAVEKQAKHCFGQ